MLAALGVGPASALDASAPLSLSAADRVSIAAAFAPVLVFHPAEEYFPLNPVFPSDVSAPDVLDDSARMDARARLGSQSDRIARYRALTTDEKLRLASLQYRVFTRSAGDGTEVVVEYWCYYVFNAFSLHLSWLPFRISDNHPHDLERLYLVLTPVADSSDRRDEGWPRRAFRIERVIANAHDGNIPPNQYEVSAGETLTAPVTVLVERGSHAMAPDINRDGRFTPEIDSTGTTKLLWGIRDGGATWGRYRSSYMDVRGETSVRLCAATSAAADDRCRPYALYPADDLQDSFRLAQFSSAERRTIVGHTPWLLRAVSDVRVEHLLVPSDPADGRALDAMLRRHAATHEGYFVGWTTTGAHVPTVLVGRRYFREVSSRFAPDLVAEGAALFPAGGRRLAEATVLGSYSIDAITNVVVGTGWFSNARSPMDVLAGVDLRVGLLRVRPSWRFRGGGFDSRVTASF